MKPLIWRSTQDVEPDGHAIFDNTLRKTDSYIFMQGKKLPCSDINSMQCSQDPKEYDLVYTYRYSEAHLKRFDCLPNTGQSPLVNKKVLDLLNKLCPDDIQAFPAKIMPEPDSSYTFENHDYWVININSLTDAIDKEKTEFLCLSSALGGHPYGAKKLILTEKDGSYFLREKTLKTLELVSPSIVQAFEKANVTGVEFIEDKDY